VRELSEADLDRVISYVSVVDRRPRRFRIEDILLHLFPKGPMLAGVVLVTLSKRSSLQPNDQSGD